MLGFMRDNYAASGGGGQSAASLAAPLAPVYNAGMTEPVRILVVDDDEHVRAALSRYLSKTGYQVTQADGGAAALESLAAGRFDAMLCDIRMPGMTGVELLPKVIAHDPDIAVLMLTAVGDPSSAIACLKIGAADYLIKPVELEELSHALRYALRRRELEIERRSMEQWLAREVAEKTRELEEQSQRVEYLSVSILTALVDAIDASSPTGRNHSSRVASLSAHVAARLALAPDEVEAIRVAGRLHDLGRVALRDEVLLQVSRATPAEVAGDAGAPAVAARILEPLQHHREVVEIIRLQHERWDGQGTPEGRKGDAIPLGSRVLAAVNLYDELTEGPTSGRAPLLPEEALTTLKGLAGTLLDPAVVTALEGALAHRGL